MYGSEPKSKYILSKNDFLKNVFKSSVRIKFMYFRENMLHLLI